MSSWWVDSVHGRGCGLPDLFGEPNKSKSGPRLDTGNASRVARSLKTRDLLHENNGVEGMLTFLFRCVKGVWLSVVFPFSMKKSISSSVSLNFRLGVEDVSSNKMRSDFS